MDIPSALEDARILISRGKKRQARSLLREIARVDPNNVETYVLFAQVAEKQEDAIYSLERALKISPNNRRVQSQLASVRSTPRTNQPKRLFIGVFGFLILLLVAMFVWISTPNSSDSSSAREQQTNTTYKEAEKKFGYTESERKQIWKDIIRAEDRADVDALLIYPDMTPYNDWRNLFDELADKYKLGLAQKLGLSMEQLDEIGYEGIEKGWPFPPLP